MTANMLLYKSFILCWLSSVSVAFVNGPRRVTPRATTSWSSTTLLGMGLTLYGSQGSRSPLVNWALYELGLEFEMGDLRKNPHPFGQIPCLTDNDDVSVFESGAILLYINSLSEEKLSPAEKAQVMSWVMWANASLDPICFLETPDGKVYDTGLKKPNKRIETLNALLQGKKFIVGDKLTVADVAISSYLLYVLQFFPGTDLSRWPHLVTYLQACVTRPAYGQAFGEQTQVFLEQSLADMGKKQTRGIFDIFQS